MSNFEIKTTMKQTLLLLIMFTYAATGSFANAFNNGDKTINIEASKVEWLGKKVTGKHNGTIAIKAGSLSFENDQLTGGQVVIDMTSIKNLDLSGNMAGRLEGHLKSDDFFGVASHPEATLDISKVDYKEGQAHITADLTIKGKTAPVMFSADISASNATAEIVIDRTLYDVRYGSGKFFDNLGDKMIDDNFTLTVNLTY